MRRRTQLLAAAAVAAVAVVAAIGTAGTRRSSPAPGRTATIETLGGAGTASHEHHYRVALEYATSQQLGVVVEGVWAVGVIGAAPDHTVYRGELRDAQATVTGNGKRVDDHALAGALAVPYTFTVAADGRLTQLAFPRDVDARARGTLVTLATSFQISPAAGLTWEATEAGALGEYRVSYRRYGAQLTKTKLRYTGDDAAARVLESATTIALRPDRWPARITGAEKLQVGPAELAMEVSERITLEHAGTAPITVTTPPALEPIAIAALRTRPGDDPDADRELVDGATLPDLLAELALVTNDGHASGYLFLRLAALFRLDAEAARGAARDVIAGRSKQPNAVVGALGEAGTREAQTALAEVLARAPDEARMHAAAALGITRAPTAETLAALATAATGTGEIASTATLAVGNAARQLRATDPARAEAQLDTLLARLGAARDDSERALCLRALGNLGDPRMLDPVALALTSDSAMVRTAAAESLRHIPGARADELVIAALADPFDQVRSAAVFAAGFRDLERFAAPLSRALQREPELEVRRAIVELALLRLVEVPALRAILIHAAKHEPDAQMRAAATARL